MGPQVSPPRVVTVAGMKKSGKTTVAAAVISELVSRGFPVGSVKTMLHHLPSLSAEATDTRRHEEAGASVVVALHAGGTARFERGAPSRSLAAAARLFPPEIAIVVCEGTLEPADQQLYIVCLRDAESLGETLRDRRVPPGRVAAVAGPAATVARDLRIEVEGGPRVVPCFDVLDSAQKSRLVDLILAELRRERDSAQ